MHQIVLFVSRHFHQCKTDHKQDQYLDQEEKNLLVLQHAEGGALVFKILQYENILQDRNIRFSL